jgi:uncharacterized SAM-binding protein YcdF (DUF218 family)
VFGLNSAVITMNAHHDIGLRKTVRRRRIGSIGIKLIVLAAIVFVGGFGYFIWQLPDQQVELDRNADGIVVLTGGDSRVSDALDYNRLLTCCVDLDYSAINTLGNAVGTRQWTLKNSFHSLIVVTSAYHMPRALAELSHQLPEVALIPYPVVSDRLRVEPWWSNGATTKVVLSEYFKYLAAKLRMQFESAPASS